MIIKKIHFVIDNTNKAKPFRKKIHKKYKNYPPKTSDVIVVLGGDGFMLQTLKKYQKYDKPFYGMNRGTFDSKKYFRNIAGFFRFDKIFYSFFDFP